MYVSNYRHWDVTVLGLNPLPKHGSLEHLGVFLSTPIAYVVKLSASVNQRSSIQTNGAMLIYAC